MEPHNSSTLRPGGSNGLNKVTIEQHRDIEIRQHQSEPVREVTLKRELDGIVTQMHSAGVSYAEAVKQFKKRYILEVLAQHKGNQCKAAEELGMHRNTLSRTLAELDLDTAQIRNGMRRPPTSERPRLHSIVANAR